MSAIIEKNTLTLIFTFSIIALILLQQSMISIIPIRSTFCLFSNHRLLHNPYLFLASSVVIILPIILLIDILAFEDLQWQYHTAIFLILGLRMRRLTNSGIFGYKICKRASEVIKWSFFGASDSSSTSDARPQIVFGGLRSRD